MLTNFNERNNSYVVKAEEILEKLDLSHSLYPITLIKLLLNRGRILNFVSKAMSNDFEIKTEINIDPGGCKICEEKRKENIQLCRQHTSIHRVLEEATGPDAVVGFDIDTNLYLFKNEIFRMAGDKLVIVYCPHPSLLKNGEYSNSKVRKVVPITIKDETLKELPNYKVSNFISSKLMMDNISCWFNTFCSIVTIPKDTNSTNWCLVPNF